MVDCCANPACLKPLHYLREGRIYAFDAHGDEPKSKTGHRLEHYWLCGTCSVTFRLERVGAKSVRLIPRRFDATTGIRIVPTEERKAS